MQELENKIKYLEETIEVKNDRIRELEDFIKDLIFTANKIV